MRERQSPLAQVAYTPAAFWRAHPEFDIAGWGAVVWAETNLARDRFAARTNNIGCIRGGNPSRPWRYWRVDTTSGGFNVYPSIYIGQRAHIRLVWAKYNLLLRTHQWDAFARVYWGEGYPESYVATLRHAHEILVAEAQERGLTW